MTENSYENIIFEVDQGVGKITFNLPQYGNALDLPGIMETLDALLKAETRDDIGVVVMTGSGNAFCSGFNLKKIPDVDQGISGLSEHFQELALWWHQIFHRMVRLKKPILAAVNGPAAGSGLGLALCSDMVLASENATFLCAWHTIGLANDATTSYSLAKIVGFRRAFELMYTNRTLSAEEACDWQIVNRVYDNSEFSKNVELVAKQLADAPTHLQGMAKESFHMGWRRSVEEATEYEIQNVMKSVENPYFVKALTSFLNKNSRSNLEQVVLPD